MSAYLVTVKLPRNPHHNPAAKVTAACPANPDLTCTDSTGAHHTLFAANAADRDAIIARFDHITRVEEA